MIEISHYRDGRLVSQKTEKGLGDKIAAIATPVARLLKSDCIDPDTGKLKETSGCAKMKERLNAGMSVGEALRLRLKGQ